MFYSSPVFLCFQMSVKGFDHTLHFFFQALCTMHNRATWVQRQRLQQRWSPCYMHAKVLGGWTSSELYGCWPRAPDVGVPQTAAHERETRIKTVKPGDEDKGWKTYFRKQRRLWLNRTWFNQSSRSPAAVTVLGSFCMRALQRPSVRLLAGTAPKHRKHYAVILAIKRNIQSAFLLLGPTQKMWRAQIFIRLHFSLNVFFLSEIHNPWFKWRNATCQYYHCGGDWGNPIRPLQTNRFDLTFVQRNSCREYTHIYEVPQWMHDIKHIGLYLKTPT